MKATGVVVEHNPFHNGHAYHIEQARQSSGADIVVAVMSGNFLQRGEPALVDKWTRAGMSLANGVDLVVELPYRYATASATEFAAGSIHLLEQLGCTSFVFGSEHGKIQSFLDTYHLIHSNRDKYELAIRQSLQAGNSYPMALQHAFLAVAHDATEFVDLSQPNNILGYHYVEAALSQSFSIQPLTIERIGAGYHEFIQQGQSIASATGIRHALFETMEIPGEFVPKETLQALTGWYERYQQYGSWEQFWPRLRYAILSNSPEQLRNIAEVTEGIEHAIRKHALVSASYSEFMHRLKSKRYTWTRLQRMMTHIYTGFQESSRTTALPDAVRLLGRTDKGQQYLGQIKKGCPLPIVSRLASSSSEFLALDTKVSDLYYLGFESSEVHELVGSEFKRLPLKI